MPSVAKFFGVRGTQRTTDNRQRTIKRMSSSRKIKYVADVMLGRCTRWLRMFGCDVVYQPIADDDDLLFMALLHNRILLTRDMSLARKAGAAAYLVRANSLWARLREIINHFDIQPVIILKRCPVCNGKVEEIPKESIDKLVPPYTFKTHDVFWQCLDCGKVYWHGSHLELAQRDIEKNLGICIEEK